jgi:hypothetical protein
MLALIRGRSKDAHAESWLIFYGDVQVGAIKLRTGNPWNTPSWEWRCGFYPGGRPGECSSGTAPTFELARTDFGRAWDAFLSKRTDADFRAWRHQQDWTAESIGALIGANGCRQNRMGKPRPTEAALLWRLQFVGKHIVVDLRSTPEPVGLIEGFVSFRAGRHVLRLNQRVGCPGVHLTGIGSFPLTHGPLRIKTVYAEGTKKFQRRSQEQVAAPEIIDACL